MSARIIPRIFNEAAGAHEEKGEHARLSAFIGAIAVADLVKTTLGPKGMDKMLQSVGQGNKVSFTNDGATILKSIPIDNAAAKIIVDTSKTQDEEVGDGTTSVAVLAGELLREAEKLIMMKIHPQTILRGWRKAVVAARAALEDCAEDHSKDPKQFREDLFNIARTTLSSKILSTSNDYFAKLSVDAVMRLKGSMDLSLIQIIKMKGGSLRDSYLEEGFILKKRIGVGQPKRIENPKIMVANTSLDTDKIKIYGARVRVKSVEQVASIERAERDKMKRKVENILAHKPDVFISRQLIYNFPEQMFTSAGVCSIEHADFEGVERLAKVLGAEIASTFATPGSIKLGECKVLEEVVIGESKVIRFSGVAKGDACTVVLRGGSDHILDEAERSLHDALCILSQTTQNPKRIYGGGCSEMAMANAVTKLGDKTPGKEALAIHAFARALTQIPTIIADNAGFDSHQLIAQLRAAHINGHKSAGLDMNNGTIGDMAKLKVAEAYKSKFQVLVSAHEAAEMILRVDDIIACAPRKRDPRQGH
jgi:T-complex protein 1 subunit beta